MASPYYFDARLGAAAVEFFPRYLKLTTAEWAGRPFELSPWQAHHTAQIFGWRRRSNGMRRYRRVRGWVPKKSGKTEWFAGIAHILTVGDGEPGAEVFSHATTLDQASIIWRKAVRMIELDVVPNGRVMVPGPLAKLYEASKTALFCPHLMSAFKPLSGDPAGKHGPNVHGALGDEVHEYPDGTLHRHLIDGMSARRQPLDATFSSAGRVKTYGHDLYCESIAIRDDETLDPECYVFAYGAEPDDDWTDPAVWAKACPNYPITPKHEFMVDFCRQAQRSPRLENEFKQYYLGLWTEQTTRWFPMHRWRDNTSAPDDADLWKRLPELMRGRPAWGGLDLGSTDDISALVWWFPPTEPDGRHVIIPRFWVPSAIVPERDKPVSPYKSWIASGALCATPGNVTDYDFIEHAIGEDAERFRVKHSDAKDATQFDIAIDRWNATQVAVHLGNDGLKVARFGQGFASMAAPAKEVERLFLTGKLEHGNHPVLKWMFGNAAYKRDPAGNIKPDKAAATDKIDGVVAAIMANGIAMVAKRKAKSFWERAA